MTPEQIAGAREMWERGKTAGQISLKFGVTRNAVIGVANRGKWTAHEPTTLFTRCDELNANLDAVLKTTAGIGRVPNVPKLLQR